jgi:hypothetical protein
MAGGGGVSEKTGAFAGEEHPVNAAAMQSRPLANNTRLVVFQDNFIVPYACETARTINTFV